MPERRRKQKRQTVAEFSIPPEFEREVQRHWQATGQPLLRYRHEEYTRSIFAEPMDEERYELMVDGSPELAYGLMEYLLVGGMTLEDGPDGQVLKRIPGRLPPGLPFMDDIEMVVSPFPGSDYSGVWVRGPALSFLQYAFDHFGASTKITLDWEEA